LIMGRSPRLDENHFFPGEKKRVKITFVGDEREAASTILKQEAAGVIIPNDISQGTRGGGEKKGMG